MPNSGPNVALFKILAQIQLKSDCNSYHRVAICLAFFTEISDVRMRPKSTANSPAHRLTVSWLTERRPRERSELRLRSVVCGSRQLPRFVSSFLQRACTHAAIQHRVYNVINVTPFGFCILSIDAVSETCTCDYVDNHRGSRLTIF